MTSPNWKDFADILQSQGLRPRECTRGHWQILGGKTLVNCWPCTKRGFVIQADGKKSRVGTIEEGVQLANSYEKTVTKQMEAPWQESSQPSIGLIRRFWRWIW